MLFDSLDKIIGTYFAAVTAETFSYKGNVYTPKLVKVSPTLFRGFTCPEGCGGCCPTFTLDYLPTEEFPYELDERLIEFNGKQVSIYSDTQPNNNSFRCRNLNWNNGRCSIHGHHPFSCDFELIGFHVYETGSYRMSQRLFGRGWSYRRTDGGIGAKCELTNVSEETIEDVRRKLRRLYQWADHFGLETHINKILEWSEGAPRLNPLYLNTEAVIDDRATFFA